MQAGLKIILFYAQTVVPMSAAYYVKALLIIPVLLFCQQVFSQSTLSKRQRYDSSVQENYRIQYEFLKLSDADTVVDIGTGAGYNLSRIAGHFSKTHFIAEDIDSSHSNKALFVNIANRFGYQPNMENITFCVGTETSTGLPVASFSKVLAFDVVHEWTYKAEMLADIKRILRKNGSLLIGEILAYKKRKRARTCRYPFLLEPEMKEILATNGFQLVREQLVMNELKTSYVKLFEYQVNE